MSERQDREDRRRRARDEDLVVRMVSPPGLPGAMGVWEVTGNSGRVYKVTVYDPDGQVFDCECPDFRIRRAGLCKHIAAVLEEPAGKGGP